MLKTKSGFTIVELLIVIVVIGILAAITVVAFNGIQNRANDVAVKNDLKNIATKAELFRVDNDRYPSFTGEIESMTFKASKPAYALNPTTATNITFCYADQGKDYATISLSKSGKIFYILGSSGSRVVEYSSAWEPLADSRCGPISPTLLGSNRNYNGYSIADTTTGPWRAWAGGN